MLSFQQLCWRGEEVRWACAEHHEERVEASVKPVKQEKVKMGFQLYRPPTLLTQVAPEVVFQSLPSCSIVAWLKDSPHQYVQFCSEAPVS